mmetsp:Transcript_17732/g.24956  ORF Transcript_17732/g.24956 Transcript_17732/m.24956 type:complete len:234 (+) Transcript_17732:2565-3266(+)
MASAGDSTLWTKVTPAILCMISGTSLGLVIAIRILSVMCSISLFPITVRDPFMAAIPAALTCFLVSHMQAVTSGTISGRAFPSCFGAVSLKVLMQLRASSRVCHFFSTGNCEKIAGRSDFIANGEIFLEIAMAVSVAAFLTEPALAEACSKHAARHSLVKASASGQPSAKALAVARPARASASSLAAHFATRASMLAAKPDFATPSAFTASTIDDSSPTVSLANCSSRDIVKF